MSSLGRQIQDLEQAQDARISPLEKAAASFDEWRPHVEGTVDNIRLEVKKISLRWERPSIKHPEDKSGVFASTPATTQRPSAEVPTTLPVMGPGVANQYRESGFGVVWTLIHSRIKGEPPIPQPPSPVSVL